MCLDRHVVPLQEFHGALDAAGCVLLIGGNTHDMHLVRAVQPDRLEHLQGTGRLRTAIIGDHHRLPRGQ